MLAYNPSHMDDAASYRPPAKFKTATIEQSPSSPLPSITSEANLKNKQLWHIMAPGTPSLLEARAHSMNGQPKDDTSDLHRRVRYEFKALEGPEACLRYVVTPPSSGSRYKACTRTLKGKLEIQQAVKMLNPEKSLGETEGAVKLYTEAKSLPRQPDGLRERHKPLGAVVSNPCAIAKDIAGRRSEVSSSEKEFRMALEPPKPRHKGSPSNVDVKNARYSPPSSPERKRKRTKK